MLGLFGGDFGLRTKTQKIFKNYKIQNHIKSFHNYLPFMDDSLDKTLDDELLSLCASFNSLRYSSPDDMNGTGVTRSELWKDIGDAQLVISTQDSKKNKRIDFLDKCSIP